MWLFYLFYYYFRSLINLTNSYQRLP